MITFILFFRDKADKPGCVIHAPGVSVTQHVCSNAQSFFIQVYASKKGTKKEKNH